MSLAAWGSCCLEWLGPQSYFQHVNWPLSCWCTLEPSQVLGQAPVSLEARIRNTGLAGLSLGQSSWSSLESSWESSLYPLGFQGCPDQQRGLGSFVSGPNPLASLPRTAPSPGPTSCYLTTKTSSRLGNAVSTCGPLSQVGPAPGEQLAGVEFPKRVTLQI